MMEISITGFLSALSVLLLGGFWWDSLRTRELAIQFCQAACHTQGVQFLDQSVALHHLTWGRSSRGVSIQRTYRFDFSVEGIGRRTGYLVMNGQELVMFHLFPSMD